MDNANQTMSNEIKSSKQKCLEMRSIWRVGIKIRDTWDEKVLMMAKTSAAFPMGVAEAFDYLIARLNNQK